MNYFDIFLILKYVVLGAIIVAAMLSLLLFFRNLSYRLKAVSAVGSENEAVASDIETVVAEVHAVTDAEAAPAAESQVAQKVEPQPAANLVSDVVETPATPEKPVVAEKVVDEKFAVERPVPQPSVPEHQTVHVPEYVREATSAQPGETVRSEYAGFTHSGLAEAANQPTRRATIAELLSQVQQSESLYQPTSGLLLPHERLAYHSLKNTMPAGAMVMCKLRVADVLASQDSPRAAAQFEILKSISTQYFTFVVCDSQTLMPHGFIELIGQGSSKDETAFIKKRLQLLRQISSQANFPMMVVNIAGEFPAQQVRQALSGLACDDDDNQLYSYLSIERVAHARDQSSQMTTAAHSAQAQHSEKAERPAGSTCPACGDTLKYRISREGKFKGRVFHVCESYPECSHIRILPDMDDQMAHSEPQSGSPTRTRERQFA